MLAFGFLGPKPQLAEVCAFFKVYDDDPASLLLTQAPSQCQKRGGAWAALDEDVEGAPGGQGLSMGEWAGAWSLRKGLCRL